MINNVRIEIEVFNEEDNQKPNERLITLSNWPIIPQIGDNIVLESGKYQIFSRKHIIDNENPKIILVTSKYE